MSQSGRHAVPSFAGSFEFVESSSEIVKSPAHEVELATSGYSSNSEGCLVPQHDSESGFGDLRRALYEAATSQSAWEPEGGFGGPRGTSS
jgi:hypothetical protein